jgi:hypothetical protein
MKNESEKANGDVRAAWDETWEAYNNKQLDVPEKEGWQSDVVLPKPFATVQQAKAVIRRSMLQGSDFYKLTKRRKYQNDKDVTRNIELIKILMDGFHDENHGDFPTAFVDAAEMSFVTGQSMEMIPVWENGKFRWDLIPPWQIYRDPNAKPHKPQSGNYWVHEEKVDWWVLKALEKKGIFENINAIKEKSDTSGSAGTDEERRRRGQIYEKNEFISTHEVLDYYGIVLDKKGELLLPNGRYTVSGEQIIRPIGVVPFKHIRWPGISFSPIPHVLRFEGRGIIEAVLDIWKVLNNMINLHLDNLNWDINNLFELDPSLLSDPEDEEIYPGKTFITNKTTHSRCSR